MSVWALLRSLSSASAASSDAAACAASSEAISAWLRSKDVANRLAPTRRPMSSPFARSGIRTTDLTRARSSSGIPRSPASRSSKTAVGPTWSRSCQERFLRHRVRAAGSAPLGRALLPLTLLEQEQATRLDREHPAECPHGNLRDPERVAECAHVDEEARERREIDTAGGTHLLDRPGQGCLKRSNRHVAPGRKLACRLDVEQADHPIGGRERYRQLGHDTFVDLDEVGVGTGVHDQLRLGCPHGSPDDTRIQG